MLVKVSHFYSIYLISYASYIFNLYMGFVLRYPQRWLQLMLWRGILRYLAIPFIKQANQEFYRLIFILTRYVFVLILLLFGFVQASLLYGYGRCVPCYSVLAVKCVCGVVMSLLIFRSYKKKKSGENEFRRNNLKFNESGSSYVLGFICMFSFAVWMAHAAIR